eukprot:GEMP01032631.1.p1 GENE.GEMP01032631.1~~GEMP01032631.1.p1  ORF type:complete len:570 (+),score=133.40 GEMP01032631.1:33-1712(+)
MDDGEVVEVDDAIETLQSELRAALASGKQEHAEALFARCQGPEILVELFLIREAYPESGVDAVIDLCCKKGSAREVYTFLMEVMTYDDLTWPSKLTALPRFRLALLRMTGEPQKQFTANALVFARKHFEKCDATGTIDALASFGIGFTDELLHLEEEIMGCVAMEEALACYLFNLLPKILPRAGAYPSVTLSFEGYECFEGVVASIASLSRKFVNSPPVYPYRETHGDGGGDSEASPLAQATFLYLTETYGIGPHWARVSRIISPQRRYLFFAWVVVVMAKNGYRNVALQVFTDQIIPLLFAVTEPILDAQFYVSVLEAFTEASADQFKPTEDTLPKLFIAWSKCLRAVPFRRRFDTYFHIINNIKVDVLVGGVVTNARNDWWDYLQHHKEKGNQEPALRYLALLLVDSTLNGKITIVDGMDTLVAALNFVRLLLMSSKCKFVIRELIGLDDVSYFSTPLDKLLQVISSQVDYEFRSAPNDAVKERIQMVAHLVARVRELIPADVSQNEDEKNEEGTLDTIPEETINTLKVDESKAEGAVKERATDVGGSPTSPLCPKC